MRFAKLIAFLFFVVIAISCQCKRDSRTCGMDHSLSDLPPGFVYLDSLTIEPAHDLINHTPIYHNEEWINMVVEIPLGTNEKWEVDKNTGNLKWDLKKGRPRVIKYLPYPGHYGFIPQSLLSKNKGGDGDPLDIIALGGDSKRGEHIPVRIIGVLKLLDKGEQDDKLIAVAKDGLFHKIDSLKELDEKYPGISSILRTWFENYKGPNKIEIIGFKDRETALDLVKTALESYKNK